MVLASGTRLGPYEILGPLGVGGMGEVYRARDPRLEREVAVKVLPDDLASDRNRLRRFQTEAKAVGALNHPNILAVFDTGAAGAAPYVVFELLDGETLRKRLERGTLTARKALDYGVQISQGLAAAHDRGIVHRDLKPENLFLTRDGRVKILDFGLAKQKVTLRVADPPPAQTLTHAGTVMGTVAYMSPEQVQGLAIDDRSDIFSLGSVLYEMVAGRRPFRGGSSAETMNAILREDPPELSSTGHSIPGLERIIRRCLEKEPEERFRSARDLAYALEALSGSSPALATPPARSNLRLVPVLAAALLLALIVLGYLGRQPREAVFPSFQKMTSERGTVRTARFTSDGKTVVYGAAWHGGPFRVFSTRVDNPRSVPLSLPAADLRAISPSGELAISLGQSTAWRSSGTLATAPLAGEAVRERLHDVLHADWSPDGAELAVVRQAAGKLRLEFPIGKVLYDLPAEAYSSNVRVSPDGRWVAVSVVGALKGQFEEILVFDRDGRSTILANEMGESLAWSPAGTEVWYTQAGAVKAVDLQRRRRLITRLPGLVTIADTARDGRALLIISQVGSGISALATGNAAEQDLGWFGTADIGGLSVDGTTLLFSECSNADCDTFVRTTGGQTAAVKLGSRYYGQALSPDGAWAIVEETRNPGHLVLMPTGAGESKPLTTGGLECAEPVTWFPDGKRVLVTCRSSAPRAYIVDIDRGGFRPLTPDGTSCFAVSPDGREAVCVDASRTWFVYPTEGGAPHPVAGIGKTDIAIQWSIDGHSLFVCAPDELPLTIFRLDLASGRREPWRAIGPADPTGVFGMNAVVTPDGRSYAYRYGRDISNLWLVSGLQ